MALRFMPGNLGVRVKTLLNVNHWRSGACGSRVPRQRDWNQPVLQSHRNFPPDRQLSVQQEQSDLIYGVSHVTPQEFCVLPLDL